MCRVLRPGLVEAGTPVVAASVPGHEVTVAGLSAGLTPERASALLESGVPLTAPLRAQVNQAGLSQALWGTFWIGVFVAITWYMPGVAAAVRSTPEAAHGLLQNLIYFLFGRVM